MKLPKVKVGFAVTGSHCVLDEVLIQAKNLADAGAEVFPIISESVDNWDTRFGTAGTWKERLVKYTGRSLINSVVGAEPIGPQALFDVLVVAPCTGNTLAKIANAITDGTVLMAVKAHLRNQRPVVLAISTNDGLGMNARNLGTLLNSKNIYLVPFGQDNPLLKPNSLKAKMDLIVEATAEAWRGRQMQPLLVADF